MANTLKEIGRSLSRAWENLAEGWRELLSRSSDALTRFIPRKEEELPVATGAPVHFPSWGLLAGEVLETDREIVVRIELPGVRKEDCEITVEGNTLRIRGDKRIDREHVAESYYVMERAYGSFERVIPLPRNVDVERADASCVNGVLKVVLPKVGTTRSRRIGIS